MMVEEAIEIRCPLQDVWALVADPDNDPCWCTKVVSVKWVDERRWEVVHKPVPLRPAITLSVEQTELKPPIHLRLREEDETARFDVEYRLATTEAGTLFIQRSEFSWKKLPKLLHRPFAHGVRRDVRRQLQALKRVLESR